MESVIKLIDGAQWSKWHVQCSDLGIGLKILLFPVISEIVVLNSQPWMGLSTFVSLRMLGHCWWCYREWVGFENLGKCFEIKCPWILALFSWPSDWEEELWVLKTWVPKCPQMSWSCKSPVLPSSKSGGHESGKQWELSSNTSGGHQASCKQKKDDNANGWYRTLIPPFNELCFFPEWGACGKQEAVGRLLKETLNSVDKHLDSIMLTFLLAHS